jgi:hypothetical protein
MTAFKFRLEKVWKHRRRVVDEHSRAVAGADRSVTRWFGGGLSAWLHNFDRVQALADSGGNDRAETGAVVDFIFELDGRWDR